MSTGLVLIDREALLAELQRVFDAQTAEALLGVLDKVAAQVRQAGVTREDFDELKWIVAELTEETKKLATVQARTEERVGQLGTAMERLAEAQARTEERVGRLEAIMEENSRAVANLTRAIDQYPSSSSGEDGDGRGGPPGPSDEGVAGHRWTGSVTGVSLVAPSGQHAASVICCCQKAVKGGNHVIVMSLKAGRPKESWVVTRGKL